jgi:KDO2-lipid IV(A) lauroyltransferase
MIVEKAESDPASTAIQDEARAIAGVVVVHVGSDSLSALPLVRHLRSGGIVALQIDRVPQGMRSFAVKLFGGEASIPAGPARLAMLTGAPIVPVFASRRGFRRYDVTVEVPVRLNRFARDEEMAAAAQELAQVMERFVHAHPTQWFHFRSD